MEIYLDTADEKEIDFASQYGFLDGITTIPSIISREKDSFESIIRRIDTQINGKVWMQVTEREADEMIRQGIEMNEWTEHAVIKLPMNEAGASSSISINTKEYSSEHDINLYTSPSSS